MSEERIARRRFLTGFGLVALPFAYRGFATVAYAAGKSGAHSQGGALADYPGMIIRSREPENLEYPLSTLETFITPADQFYIRSHFATPTIDAASWRLRVEGSVESPVEITYADLLKMPSRTVVSTLECAGNSRVYLVPPVKGVSWGSGAVSNAEWTGVPLAHLLKQAGVRDSAVEIVLEGADSGEIKDPPSPSGPFHFSRSLPVRKALTGDVLLAYKMNGKDLPRSHGFPVRALVPGWYGMASVKWLTRVVAVDQPYDGYFQTIDYAYWQRLDGLPRRVPITSMLVKSEIARPTMHELVKAGSSYRISGAAWTGDSDIKGVEVSTDGGATWNAAELTGQAVRHAWRLWQYKWSTPERAGKYVVMSRATDATGASQPDKHDWDRFNYMINFTLPVEVEVV